MSPPVILLPEYRRGHGLGHFSRAASLTAELGDRAFIYLPRHLDPDRREALRAIAAARGVEHRLLADLPGDGTDRRRFFLVDRRFVTRDELSPLRQAGFVVALDAAGSGRQRCDYLVDVLPRLVQAPANVRDLRLLELPALGAHSDGGPEADDASAQRRVLVTFGGDDPRGITERVVTAIRSTGRYAGSDIDVLLPQLSSTTPKRGGALGIEVRVIRGPVDLSETLPGYETVVTSFGLTAFEAAWAGAEVLLVNASRYHQRLARKAGFRSVAVGRIPPRRLARLLDRRMRSGGGAGRVRERLAGAGSVSLSSLISSLNLPMVHDCPACSASEGRIVARFPHRTYVRCADCGMIYLRSFEVQREYPEDYFFEEYRRQYGRTYLEDAPHIRSMGHQRIEEVARAISRFCGARSSSSRLQENAVSSRAATTKTARPPRLIDLGCAYGPFLSAAAEHGYEPVGVDVSEAAVSYVVSELGFAAFCMTLEKLASSTDRPAELEDGRASVVTMWYVIEHLPDLQATLSAVSRLLEPGGVFAFSTPNAKGVSGCRSLRDFLRRSPPDHFTVWSPRTARRVLRAHGFVVSRMRVTGHHPERFPGASRLRDGGPVWRMLLALSRTLRLGDTFEVYAVKRNANSKVEEE
ncbi:MAG: methyltransferase domain-containing protein [Spirochaetes bacterium]|jgi:2-polyprenyl-3-methyl-5-hydroxy-6-metoxy-1,4-benzoquinol methylase|nr:methyltransferase domain-containing protein [Spirochaetota bacterium]